MVDGQPGKIAKLLIMKTANPFEIENKFYETSDVDRISKLIAHYELYSKSIGLKGDIFEFGVFKGVSLIQLASFRKIFQEELDKKIVAFDTFDDFPETQFQADKKLREQFISEAGSKSIDITELEKIFKKKKINNFSLIKGNILETLPNFIADNEDIKISLLHIDVDVYEPTKLILEMLFSKVIKGGVIIFDDYNVFPGETKAVNEFFKKNDNLEIKQLSFSKKRPSFMIKK